MARYNIRFVDGPNAGSKEKIEVLFYKITRHPKGKGGIGIKK